MRKLVALLTSGLTLAAVATPAFAGSYENGVRNSWENRNFNYTENTNINIDGRTDFDFNTTILEKQYSTKVDITAPNARLWVNYRNNNDKNESDVGGKLKISAHGSTSPLNPDPTFMLVEKYTDTTISGREFGFDAYNGNVVTTESGYGNSGFVEASGFINY